MLENGVSDQVRACTLQAVFLCCWAASDLRRPRQVKVDAFSSEQDELHQFVDCVLMGPYGTADLHARFDSAAGFTVPQYHRGTPGSRAFAVDETGTGGSPLRRSVMAAVQARISEYATKSVKHETTVTLNTIRNMFRNTQNMRYVQEHSSACMHASVSR